VEGPPRRSFQQCRVIDKDVQPTETAFDFLHHVRDRCLVGDVNYNREYRGTVTPSNVLTVWNEVSDDDLCACASERDRTHLADTSGPSGHHRHLAIESKDVRLIRGQDVPTAALTDKRDGEVRLVPDGPFPWTG